MDALASEGVHGFPQAQSVRVTAPELAYAGVSVLADRRGHDRRDYPVPTSALRNSSPCRECSPHCHLCESRLLPRNEHCAGSSTLAAPSGASAIRKLSAPTCPGPCGAPSAPMTVNSGIAADRDLSSANQCVFSASQVWRNRGLWYSQTGQQGMPD